MKTVGIIIAMGKEYCSLEKLLEKPLKTENVVGITISTHRLKNKTAVIARCGIGEIYAATAATILTVNYKVDELINYGFVGALSDKYKIFDMLAVGDVVHYDMDLTAFGNPLGQYDDKKEIYWRADNALTSALIKNKFPVERIASADKFVRSIETKLNIAKIFCAEMCDMESAGIAVVANKANVPFASIKLIVDGVTGDCYSEFEENAKKGAECLAKIVYEYLSE